MLGLYLTYCSAPAVLNFRIMTVMSLSLLNVGGTATGGSTVALVPAGVSSNGQKSSFLTPSSTRLAPRQIDFLSTPAKTTAADPGVARAGIKIYFGDRESTEGCCNVQQGAVIIDVGVRWHLNQPETLVDEALSYLRSVAFSIALADAIKKGILPS